jgi:hypothetical protein
MVCAFVLCASVFWREEAQGIPVLFPLGFSIKKTLIFDFCFHEQTRLPVWSVILCKIQTSIFWVVIFLWTDNAWRMTCMGTNSVSNSILAGLYWTYTMPCIQKKAVTEMTTTILMFHVHICFWEAIICYWGWLLEWEELKKDMYGYQQCVKWYG